MNTNKDYKFSVKKTVLEENGVKKEETENKVSALSNWKKKKEELGKS